MTDDRDTTIATILAAQQAVLRVLRSSFGSAWMTLDLSMAQLKTLVTLADAGALPIGQIAELLGIGQPTASHLVDRLVQTDLVVRTEDPLDRRRTLAQLSSHGVNLIEELRHIRNEPLQRWLPQLDDTALAALAHGLQALAAVAQADIDAPPRTLPTSNTQPFSKD